MAIKLLGNETTVDGWWNAAEYCVYTRFQAVASGNMVQFKVFPGYSGNVKVALYADNAGAVGSKIIGDNTGHAVTGGIWNTITFTSTAIVSGTYYWLAVIQDYGSLIGYDSAGGTSKYKLEAGNYATWAWPATGAPGYSNDASELIVAGNAIEVQTIYPSSIIQPVSYGTPTVEVGTGALIIYPTSIVQVVAIGTPSLSYPQILSPSSIVVTIVYGTPSVGTYGIIVPQSIIQQISIGSPTILKYVWHVILDGQYATETPGVNRAYVIGRDAYGNPVWGEAHDSAESSLVGERLDFTQELAIPITAQAGDVASAVLAKMRLRGKGGVILIPPNCGQELFDVVQISDAGANQSAVTFRVVGIRFEYCPRQAQYFHRLILGAP